MYIDTRDFLLLYFHRRSLGSWRRIRVRIPAVGLVSSTHSSSNKYLNDIFCNRQATPGGSTPHTNRKVGDNLGIVMGSDDQSLSGVVERDASQTARAEESYPFPSNLKLPTMRLSPLRVLLTLAVFVLCGVGFYDQSSVCVHRVLFFWHITLQPYESLLTLSSPRLFLVIPKT